MLDAQTHSSESALLGVRDVAALLSVSPRTVRRLADAGKMPRPKRLGSLVRWNRAELDDWLAGGCRALRSSSTKANVR